jgi:hypothetical protein
MAGARRGIATAATRMRRPPRSFARLLVLGFALLVIAGAQWRPDRAGAAQTEVKLHVLASPCGAIVELTPPT